MDVERFRKEDGGEGACYAQRAHYDQRQDSRVDRQMDDVRESEETDASYERGDAHRLRPQHGRQQFPDEHVEHGERGGDTEFPDHSQ